MRDFSQKNGFVLMLALIIIGAVLSIGIGTVEIVTRELSLSSSSKESLKAFYAADSGVGCVYYNYLEGNFAVLPATIDCAGQILNISDNDGDGIIEIDNLILDNGSCADFSADTASLPGWVIIISRGYNLDCGSSDPRKVERGVGFRFNPS